MTAFRREKLLGILVGVVFWGLVIAGAWYFLHRPSTVANEPPPPLPPAARDIIPGVGIGKIVLGRTTVKDATAILNNEFSPTEGRRLGVTRTLYTAEAGHVVYEWIQSDMLPTGIDEDWQATIVGGVIVAMRYDGANHGTTDGVSVGDSKQDVLNAMGLPVKETHRGFLSLENETLEYHGVRFFLDLVPTSDGNTNVLMVSAIEVFDEPR